MSISENIAMVVEKIKSSAQTAGREVDEVILVGVSKTQPVEKLLEAKEAGIHIFGENKVQELLEKYDHIDNVSWHFIGRLQRNKVKYIIDKVDLIHSVDSFELASEIDKRASKANIKMPILIQINIGKEESKSGIFEEELEEFAYSIKDFENIVVSGVMAIPPPSHSDEEAKVYFKRMKELFNTLKQLSYENFNIRYLSMGMTHDFETAIKEGANIVRIGTGIFGERNYKQEG